MKLNYHLLSDGGVATHVQGLFTYSRLPRASPSRLLIEKLHTLSDRWSILRSSSPTISATFSYFSLSDLASSIGGIRCRGLDDAKYFLCSLLLRDTPFVFLDTSLKFTIYIRLDLNVHDLSHVGLDHSKKHHCPT